MSMLSAAVIVVGGLIAIWTSSSLFSLARNYIKATKIGLPIRVIPVSHTNPFWMLIDRKIISITKRLPFGDNSFTRYNYRAWELQDRYRSHHELGDAFVLVSPGRNWLYVANPDTLTEIFRRRTDFPRCLELTGMIK
jgi:hypothetical protein